VKPIDDRVLRRRLHEELGLAEAGPPPVEAVFRRARRSRGRRRAALASGAAVLAVAAGLLAVRAYRAGPPGSTQAAHPAGPGGVFAAGTADGKPWQLAAVNLADPGWCLPGVVLNGQQGDLLLPGFARRVTIGNAAFLTADPSRPGIGFGFLTLRPGVTGVTARFGDGTVRNLRLVTVSVCGRWFRLAGFAAPRQGVLRFTARSPQGRPIGFTPPAGFFSPGSPYQEGYWLNVQGATAAAASGEIGSGTVRGRPWRVRVTLGPDGECFGASVRAGGPGAATASGCAPVTPAAIAGFTMLRCAIPGGTVTWYAAAVDARTAYVRARLSDGRTLRLLPAIVGGRAYAVAGVAAPARLTRLTEYNRQGHVLVEYPSISGGR
jgi:hypothetical protein